MMENDLVIADRKIGANHATYFIADIAANHDGDLGRAKELIHLAAEAGADAAKFQHFQARSIVSDIGFRALGDQQSHQANWEKSVFDVYQDASVDLGWTPLLKAACDDAGIAFFTTPYSLELVDHIDPYVPAYKIGSGDITWHEIIRYTAAKRKPIILATGASSANEVVEAVEQVLGVNRQLALMQCNTNYSGSLDNMRHIQLNVLKTYRTMFPGVALGLSDHTPGHATVLGAVALDARIIEKHFTDDTSRIGPDHCFAMDPKAWREMVDRTRELENALGTGIKRVEGNESHTVVLQRRSIRLKRSISAGQKLSLEDLEVLRPCPEDALPPKFIDILAGKIIRANRGEGDYIRFSDIDLTFTE